jgi:hypothetical protein
MARRRVTGARATPSRPIQSIRASRMHLSVTNATNPEAEPCSFAPHLYVSGGYSEGRK